jgi:hypothetical protein
MAATAAVCRLLRTGVDTIYSTGYAFCAKLVNGCIVTWGYADAGGDSSSVQAPSTRHPSRAQEQEQEQDTGEQAGGSEAEAKPGGQKRKAASRA